MKRKMKITITFDENSEVYSVSNDLDGMDLEAFLGGMASVLSGYKSELMEDGISPADIGFMFSLALMQDWFGDDEDEEF